MTTMCHSHVYPLVTAARLTNRRDPNLNCTIVEFDLACGHKAEYPLVHVLDLLEDIGKGDGRRVECPTCLTPPGVADRLRAMGPPWSESIREKEEESA